MIKKAMKDVKTIIFDYDGTLHDSAKIYVAAFRQVYREMVSAKDAPEREFQDEEITKWLGYSVQDMWDSFMPEFSQGKKMFYAGEVGRFMTEKIRNKEAVLYDGALETLQYLKDKGYHLYILSNYGAWTYAKTKDQSLGFLKDVDGALFSFEVKQIKPEPEIYHSLLERFHLRAEECVFLDDRQNNVDGAIACGISAIRFTGYEDARQKLKEYGVEC